MTDDMDAITGEAAALADRLMAFFAGSHTAAALWAISIILADVAIDLGKADVEGILDVVGRGARDELARRLRERPR